MVLLEAGIAEPSLGAGVEFRASIALPGRNIGFICIAYNLTGALGGLRLGRRLKVVPATLIKGIRSGPRTNRVRGGRPLGRNKVIGGDCEQSMGHCRVHIMRSERVRVREVGGVS